MQQSAAPRPVPVPPPPSTVSNTRQTPWRHPEKPMLVMESECSFAADMSKATIVVEHEGTDFPRAIEDLQAIDARNLALQYAAAHGVSDVRLNGNLIGPYAVNEDGVALEDVAAQNASAPLPPMHEKMRPARYRVNVPVTRRLI